MGQEMPHIEWVRVSFPKSLHKQQVQQVQQMQEEPPEKLRGAEDPAGTYFNLV